MKCLAMAFNVCVCTNEYRAVECKRKHSVKSIACYFPKDEFRQLISEIDKHTKRQTDIISFAHWLDSAPILNKLSAFIKRNIECLIVAQFNCKRISKSIYILENSCGVESKGWWNAMQLSAWETYVSTAMTATSTFYECRHVNVASLFDLRSGRSTAPPAEIRFLASHIALRLPSESDWK